MIYAFHDVAGAPTLTLEGDLFKHLIKARRADVGDVITLRSLSKEESFVYEIITNDKKSAQLQLKETQNGHCEAHRPLHLGWCLIDPKSIEKVLPSLVELGVSSISFIHCDRSQHQFKPDKERLERIILGAMQQSGRTTKMRLFFDQSMHAFLQAYPKSVVLDFSDEPFNSKEAHEIQSVLIGAEGGFSPKEKERLQHFNVKRLNTPMVLRSETAILAISSLLLL